MGGAWAVLCYSMFSANGCFVITCFFAKVQETEKPPKSHRKEYRKASNLWLSRTWWISFQFFSDTEMYRKNRVFDCKNRANGRAGWRAWWVGLFGKTEKPKRNSSSPWFSTVCCFRWLFGSFSVAFRCASNPWFSTLLRISWCWAGGSRVGC